MGVFVPLLLLLSISLPLRGGCELRDYGLAAASPLACTCKYHATFAAAACQVHAAAADTIAIATGTVAYAAKKGAGGTESPDPNCGYSL